MNLIRFSPRSFTPWFDDFDRFLENVPSSREPRSGVWAPGVDIVENEKQIVLRADLPGVDEKNIDIQVEDGTLTMKAERKFEKETKDGEYRRVERAYGSFHRSFALPENVDAERVAAAYNKGVLEVTIPKVEAKAKAKKVQVVDVK